MSEVNVFDPGQVVVRWGWEPQPGIPRAGQFWHDIVIAGEKLGAQSEFVERPDIVRNGMMLAPMLGKLKPGGEIEFGAFNPLQDWWLWALMLGGYDVPSGPAVVNGVTETGTYIHKLHRTGATAFPQTACLRIDRNDGMPARYTQCLTNKLAIKWQEGQLIKATFSAIVGQFDLWGDAVPTGGNTGTQTPYMRGIIPENYTSNAGSFDVYAKVTAKTSSTVTIESKRGTGTSYGTAYVVPRGAWTWGQNELGGPLGDRGSPGQFFFPLPVSSPAADFAVGDEFHFPAQCPDWLGSISYEPSIAVNEIYSAVIVNGESIEVESGELTVEKPAQAKGGVGLRQPRRTRTRGLQKVTGKVQREYQTGFNFQQMLVEGGPFSLVLDCHSGPAGLLGVTGFSDFAQKITMNNLTAKGKTASAESQTKMDESVDYQAGVNPGDATYPDDITVELTDNRATLVGI